MTSPSLIAAAIHAHVTGTDAVVGARVGEVAQTWNAYRRGRIRPGEAKIAEWCRKAGLSVTLLPDGSVRVDDAPVEMTVQEVAETADPNRRSLRLVLVEYGAPSGPVPSVGHRVRVSGVTS